MGNPVRRVSHLYPELLAPARVAHVDTAERFAHGAAVPVDRHVARFLPLALELARAAGLRGIVAFDLIDPARGRLLTGGERLGALGYLTHVPRAAGLVTLRRKFRRAHGVLQQVYVLPEYVP